MSTLPPPHEGPRAESPLTARERAVLDDIAGRENAGDPGFVSRLGTGRTADGRAATRREVLDRARRRDRLIQLAVVVGLAGLLLPAAWFAALAVTTVLLAVPIVLVVLAWREAAVARQGTAGRGPAPDADPAS